MKRRGILLQLILLILVAFGVLFFNGCAAKKSIWGDPESGLLLTYRLARGQVWKTESTSQQITNMEMMGQSMESTTDINMVVSYKGEGLTSDQNLQMTATVDSMLMATKSMRGEQKIDVQGLVGKPFGFVLSPLGDEVAFQNADDIAVDLGPMAGGVQPVSQFLRDPFPNLSKEMIKVGETWTHHVDEKIDQSGRPMHIVLDFTNTLEKTEIFQGETCAVIQSVFEGTLNGEGERMGANFTIDGDIEGKTTYYFAYTKGCFLKLNTRSITESTIAVTGQTNMTIPMSQEANLEINLSL